MGWIAELFNVLHPIDAEEQEPANFKQACSDSRWVKSMEEEYQSLIQNKTWKLVPRQRWMNVITSKWVYKCKREENTLKLALV
jgi:hypothetical protein